MPSTLFEGIPDEFTHHDNLTAYREACEGRSRAGLVLRGADRGGTENHRDGYIAAAARQVLSAIETGDQPQHANALDEVAEYGADELGGDRRGGHQGGEVLSTSYSWLAALFVSLQWHDVLHLLTHHPEHRGLRQWAGEILAWWGHERWLHRMFRGSSGVWQAPGIRWKHHPEINLGPSLVGHCHDRPIADPHLVTLVNKASGQAVRKHLATEALLCRSLMRSREGTLLRDLSEPYVAKPRLATEVGVWRLGSAYRAVMPEVRVIPESRGMPPKVCWEVHVLVDGTLHSRLLEGDRRVRVGEIMRHPHGAVIPADWEVIGPESPLTEAPPWDGDARELLGGDTPPAPPPVEEPEPAPEINPGSLTAGDFDSLTGPLKRSALQAIFAVAKLKRPPKRIVRVRDRLATEILENRSREGGPG